MLLSIVLMIISISFNWDTGLTGFLQILGQQLYNLR